MNDSAGSVDSQGPRLVYFEIWFYEMAFCCVTQATPNSEVQMVLLPQPPKQLGLQICVFVPSIHSLVYVCLLAF